MRKKVTWLAAGFSFALLWASASTATKLGLVVAQPLVIAGVRFAVASLILLFLAHVVFRHRLPNKKEWRSLALCGFLNITVYLGCYVMAMQNVTAGIGTLAVASNPVFIGFLSAVLLQKGFSRPVLLSIVVCSLGVLCAAWPLLRNADVNPKGLLTLFFGMMAYSAGALYFSSRQWNGLSLLTINAWQTLFGGLFLLPFTIYSYKASANHFNNLFWLPVMWLAVPVSIVAVQLWLWLLRINTLRAGLWLFLCPPFGFAFAAWLLKDAITVYTVTGVLLVMLGLLISKSGTGKNDALAD